MKSVRTVLLTTLVLVPAAGAWLTFKPPPTQPQVAAPLPEKPLIAQINDVRASAGKPPLTEDPLLDQEAQAKVNDQVNRNYWEHHLPGESTFQFMPPEYSQSPIKRATSENIAKCQTSDAQRVDNWAHSPSHYATMIGDYDRIGWAERVNPKDNNCVYAVTEFIKQ